MKSFSILFTFAILVVVSAQSSFWSSFKNILGFGKTEEAVSAKEESAVQVDESNIQLLTDIELEQSLALAKDAVSVNNFASAVSILLPVVKQIPDNKEVNMILGNSLLTTGRPDLAEAYLHSAVKLSNWTDPISVSSLAQAIQLNGDFELASKVISKGFASMNESDSSGMLSLAFGSLMEQSGNYSAAAEWYLASALSESSLPDVWLKASTLLFPSKAWDFIFAENVLMRGVKLHPESPSLIFNLGVVLHYTNRIDNAISLYKEVLRIDPTNFGAISNLATALHSVGRVEEAKGLYEQVYNIVVFNKSTGFGPVNGASVALGNFALLLSGSGQYIQADAVVSKAIAMDPVSSDLKSIKDQNFQLAESATRIAMDQAAAVQKEVVAAKWDSALNLLNSYGIPKENSAWWYFAVGMINYFRFIYDIC